MELKSLDEFFGAVEYYKKDGVFVFIGVVEDVSRVKEVKISIAQKLISLQYDLDITSCLPISSDDCSFALKRAIQKGVIIYIVDRPHYKDWKSEKDKRRGYYENSTFLNHSVVIRL